MATHLEITNLEILEEGLRQVAADQYKLFPTLWDKIAVSKSTTKLHEYDDVYNGLGEFEESVPGENTDVPEDNVSEVGKATYTARDFTKKIKIGKNLFADNLYKSDVINPLKKKGKAIAKAHLGTIESHVANVYNNAFDTDYTSGYDDKALCVADHESTDGDISNVLAVAQDFDVDALEDAILMARLIPDDRGQPTMFALDKILAYPGNEGKVLTAIESVLRPETANNDKNFVARFGLGSQFNPRLTDTNAWFLLLKDDFDNGVQIMNRQGLEIWDSRKTDDLNYQIIFTFRFDTGWTDHRSVIGTPGST